MAKTEGTWDAATIANFRKAFAELRAHPLWSGYQIAAFLLNYKSVRGLRWAAGEYHSDGWPGSNRLAAQLRESYAGVFTWTPPCKKLVPVCAIHGEPHVADCHGHPVAEVVALAPGESVRRAPTGAISRDARRCYHMRTQLFERLNVLRGELTQEQFLERCAALYERNSRRLSGGDSEGGA